jgi:SAM-dependent methyltransferase
MAPVDHPWQTIYEREGRVFAEPFPRFPEIVSAFKDHGCRTILDLGCGNGRHTVHLARAGFQVTGLDISPTGLHLTREWLAEQHDPAGLLQADFRHPLPFPARAFDGLLSTQVIHHALLAEVLGAIHEIWRVLSPGGLAFVTVAGRLHDDEQYQQIEPGTFLPLEGWEAGLPHHIFTKETLRQAFHRFRLIEAGPRAGGRVQDILAQKD